MIRKLCINTWMLLVICLTSSQPAAFAAEGVDTSNMQAAYVYNFMLLAKWPQTTAEKVLCLAGQNRESLALKGLDGRDVDTAKLKVVSITSETELVACQALFVASTEFSHLFDAALGKPILVLSNIQPDNGRTAALILASDRNKVVFDIDLPALNKSNVRLAASVLRLARSAHE